MGVLRATQSGQDQNWATKGKWYLYCMFQTNSPPPLYLDETFAITGGEGLEPNSSPKPKTLAKKDTLSRKISHNTTKVGQKKGVNLQLSKQPRPNTC